MKKLVLMLALVSFSAQVANADCLSRMVEDSKVVAKRDKVAQKVGRISYYSMGGGVLASFIFAPVGVVVFLVGVTGTLGASMYGWVDHRAEKDFALTNLIAHSQGAASATSQGYYEDVRSMIQSSHPEITNDQINGAIAIGNRDESLCPKGKGMSNKRTAKAIAAIVAEIVGSPESAEAAE